MKRAILLAASLACLAMAGACARVSLEPGSAAARPVMFELGFNLPAAPEDGAASAGGSLSGVASFTDEYQVATDPSYSADILHSLAGAPSYRWYLNGQVLPGKTAATITVGGSSSDTGALAIGKYRLTGVVNDDQAIATADWVFEVTDG